MIPRIFRSKNLTGSDVSATFFHTYAYLDEFFVSTRPWPIVCYWNFR